MTVYTVSGPTLTLLGNGANNTGNLLVADCVNPITGAVGPVTIKITNSSSTDVATVQWGDGTVPTYYFNGVSGTASGSGANATFDFTVTNSGYSATIANAGDGYIPTETITILGTDLGGASPANDATVTVSTANVLNEVASLDNGSLVGGSGYTGSSPVATSGGTGTGLTVMTFADPIVNSVLTLNNGTLVPGTGYVTGSGLATTTGGGGTGCTVDITASTPLNAVASLDNGTLVPGTGYSNATGVATTGGTGTGLTVDITQTGGVIDTVVINAAGQNYTVGDTINISGGNNDATIDVLTVTPGGEILTISVAGTRNWPQPSPEATTYVLPNSTDFVQINGPLAIDSFFLGNCASGNMYITPVQIVG